MAYVYRRQSNCLGWLAFFAMGAAVAGGMAIALLYFQKQAEERDKKAVAALPQTNHPTLGRKAEDVVKQELLKMYKREGKPLEDRYGEPKKVKSDKAKHNVVIIQVQHREAGSDKEFTDQVFILDRTKITVVKFEEWPMRKVEFGDCRGPLMRWFGTTRRSKGDAPCWTKYPPWSRLIRVRWKCSGSRWPSQRTRLPPWRRRQRNESVSWTRRLVTIGSGRIQWSD